jgi:hypothetical protein
MRTSMAAIRADELTCCVLWLASKVRRVPARDGKGDAASDNLGENLEVMVQTL